MTDTYIIHIQRFFTITHTDRNFTITYTDRNFTINHTCKYIYLQAARQTYTLQSLTSQTVTLHLLIPDRYFTITYTDRSFTITYFTDIYFTFTHPDRYFKITHTNIYFTITDVCAYLNLHASTQTDKFTIILFHR